nr:hypothetical protein [uncultured Rhodoferax sp.]
MGRKEAVEELKRVYAVLSADVSEARAATLRSPTEFNKRTLVRTCAALVEGLSYQLRQVTLATLQDTDFLAAGDLAILRETRYQLTRQGDVEERDNFQSTLSMLLFTLRIYAKNHGAAYSPATSDNGWNCLRKAFDLRDRLMHPKSLQDLLVTDAAGADFTAGIKWWDDSVGQLLAACDAADAAFLAQKPVE